MTSFFTKEIFFARYELPTALEGVDTVRKCLINLKLITLSAVRIIENEVSGFSKKLRSSSNLNFTEHVEEVN